MEISNKLSLPKFKSNIVEDFNFLRVKYNNNLSIKTKKEILSFIFDSFSAFFNFDYDFKLKFEKSEFGEEIFIYDILNMSFDNAFYSIYSECFIKYIEKCYLKSNIDSDLYRLIKLAILNNDNETILAISNNLYCEIIDERFDIVNDYRIKKINKETLNELIEKNKIRNLKLKLEVMEYSFGYNLSHLQIRNVYKCLSNGIIDSLNKSEKAYLMNLIHDYFSVHPNQKLYKVFYESLSDESTIEEMLSLVLEQLYSKGRTMIIKKRNMDLKKDVLSWLTCTYDNEIELDHIYKLEKLKDTNTKGNNFCL